MEENTLLALMRIYFLLPPIASYTHQPPLSRIASEGNHQSSISSSCCLMQFVTNPFSTFVVHPIQCTFPSYLFVWSMLLATSSSCPSSSLRADDSFTASGVCRRRSSTELLVVKYIIYDRFYVFYYFLNGFR